MKLRFILLLLILVLATSCQDKISSEPSIELNMENSDDVEIIQNEDNDYIEPDNITDTEVISIAWEWAGISEGGINEDEFIATLDWNQFELIALELQTLSSEILQKQREDPESVLRGDWYDDIKNSEHYISVVDMAENAQKPLYWIIFKSENQGLYEYICSMALDEIYGHDFTEESEFGWTRSKEFLEFLTRDILKNKDK
jgi:hypothetical protein